MATNYPTALDDFVLYVDGTTVMQASPLNDLQLAIEALEAKIGVDDSLVTTSHDYKLGILGIGQSIQAWVTYGGAVETIYDSFNISSVSKGGTGVYTFNWATDFSDTNYCIMVTISNLGEAKNSYVLSNKLAGSVTITIKNNVGAAVDESVWLAAIGDQ